MKLKSIFVRIVPVLLLVAFACTTDYNVRMKKSETTFYQGKYYEAAKMLLPDINKKDNSQLVLLMEAGMMLHAAGQFEKSNKVFIQAGKLAKKIATSVRKQAAALLTNEGNTNYKGEDFERVMIHMYAGINFIMLNKLDEARVEFKNVDNVLRSLKSEGKKKYKQNIFAKYLTAIAFEMSGEVEKDVNDTEFAYVEYKQILKLNPRLDIVKRDLQRLAKKLGDNQDLRKWQRKFGNKLAGIPKDGGEFVLLFHAGKGAVKVSRGSLMSDRAFANAIRGIANSKARATAGLTMGAILIALKSAENPIPKFKARSNRVKYLEVEANGKVLGRTVELEDIALTAVKNMEAQYPKMIGKAAIGVVAKAATAALAGAATKKIAGASKRTKGIAGLLGAVVGVATGAGLISQIKPDLRNWHTLPAKLHLGRFFLPEGNHAITVRQIGYNGKVLGTSNFNFGIKKDKKSILNFRTLY